MLPKAWSDPVWSKVIAGVILAAAAALWALLSGWWPDIAGWWSGIVSAVGAAVDYVSAKTLTPNWMLGLLGLCGCALIIRVIVAAFRAIQSRRDPSIDSYRKDHILGVIWRWKYNPNMAIYNLAPFCPTCDLQADYVHLGEHRFYHVGIRCDDCHKIVADLKPTALIAEVEGRVEREIQRKLRSGEWLQAVSTFGSF